MKCNWCFQNIYFLYRLLLTRPVDGADNKPFFGLNNPRYGRAETHDCQMYQYSAINDIKHTKNKVRSPQINGFCDALP
jgi:hypothetical protein